MEKSTPRRHILFDLTPLDMANEEIEEKTRRCYQNLKQMINNKSPKERQEIYTKHMAANPQLHTEELTIGLLVSILLEEDTNLQNEFYRDVVTISKDSLTFFSNYLNMLIIERIARLSNHSVKQIFWITCQLLKAGATIAETTCSNLIRQTAKSDLSPRNIFMAENLIDLLCDNRSWLISSTQFMVPTVIFNLMRLIMDHSAPAQKALRKKETDFVIGLIREKFDYVLQIGRDFLRMLHYLTRIPEFQLLHQDIYVNNPRLLSPKYDGAQQLLANRTPRRLFQSCLTFDMERKISFLATQVKFGNQRRYQEWFAKQYFAGGVESTMLRCDLIRYICTIIHPSNEVLCSDIIPRWAIIGWLLTTANHVVTNCRLALLFDWFAYDSKTDNIMNIEPGILIMCHSVRSHPQVTASLLEFLCRAPALFPPKVSEQIKTGIKTSLQQILEKRVLQSLTPVFFNPKFDPPLRALIRENFPEYCQIDNGISHSPMQAHHQPHQQPSVVTTIQTPPAIIAPNSISPQISSTNPTQSAPKSIQDNSAMKLDSTTDSNDALRVSDIGNLENSTSVIQAPETISKTPMRAEQKINHQDANHNARASVISTAPNQVKGTKKQRPVITKSGTPQAGGDSSDSSDLKTWGRASGLDLDEVFSKKNLLLEPISTDEECSSPGLSNPFASYSDDFFSNLSHNSVYQTHIEDRSSGCRVIYPFMEVDYSTRRCDTDALRSFDSSICNMVEEFLAGSSNETRCSLMNKLISALMELDERSLTEGIYRNIACHLARPIADDFTTRIFPSNSQDVQSLERSIASPLFILCSKTNLGVPDSKLEISVPVNILIWLVSHLRITLPLLIYYMRVRYVIQASPGTQAKPVSAQHYETFVSACRLKPEETLFEDLDCLYIYDSKMFCFLLPSIFHEYATHYSILHEDSQHVWQITNNHKLIHKVVAAIDPASLQDLLCFCLHGTCKVISRDHPLEAIEPSLKWESWEQYCFWKIVSSQSVPTENFIEILPQLDARAHPEALSSIMLILQRLDEPQADIIDHVVLAYSKSNEHFVTSLIRHWAIKTDVQELAQNLVSLFSKRSSSTQVKRKGQTKTTSKAVTSLTTKDEKLLSILEYIRLKAPRNKLLAQKELHDGLAEIEAICDDGHKAQFSALFAMRTKPTKKKKLDKDNST